VYVGWPQASILFTFPIRMWPASLNGAGRHVSNFLGPGNHISVNPELPWYDAAAKEADAIKIEVLQWTFVVYIALLFAFTITWLPVRQLTVQHHGKFSADSFRVDVTKSTLLMGMADRQVREMPITQSGYAEHFLGTCSRRAWLAFGALTPIAFIAVVAHDYLTLDKKGLLPLTSWTCLPVAISILLLLQLPLTQLWFLKKSPLSDATHVLIEEENCDQRKHNKCLGPVVRLHSENTQTLLKVVAAQNACSSRGFTFAGDVYVWNQEAYRFVSDVATSQPLPLNRLKTDKSLHVHGHVSVSVGFAVGDTPGCAVLHCNDRAEVLKFNDDGDAYMKFEQQGYQWVMEKDLVNFRIDDDGTAETLNNDSQSDLVHSDAHEMEPLLGKKEMKPIVSKDSAGLGNMPVSLELVRPDGRVRKVSLTKPGAKLCFGLPPPPGGWYGPFGFLRMVAYMFDAVVVVGVSCFFHSLFSEGGFVTFACALLVLAARLAGMAAQAHEGLANQVSEIAAQNEKFARKNETLRQQVTALEKTEERITMATGKLEGDESQLADILAQLNQVSNLAQINTMIQAFVDAESGSGSHDLCLQGKEQLHDFWSGCKNVLKKELPDFDLEELHDLSLKSGLSFTCVSLIISAVLRHCEGHPHTSGKPAKGHRAACAFLNMVLFAMEPHKALRVNSLEASLLDALPLLPNYSSTEALHSFLMDLAHEAAVVPKGAKVVPDDAFKPFARAVTNVRPWPKAH